MSLSADDRRHIYVLRAGRLAVVVALAFAAVVSDSHSPGTTVSIQIGVYKKSSSYGRQGPLGLEELARRFQALAEMKSREPPG